MKRTLKQWLMIMLVFGLITATGSTLAKSPITAAGVEAVEQQASEESAETVAEIEQEEAVTEQVQATREEAISQMSVAAENEFLILYMNQDTAEFAIKQKASGLLWYSNPPERDADEVATDHNKQRMGAQFELIYADSTGKANTFDSFAHSVLNKQYEIQPLEGGIQIHYELGQSKKGIDEIPQFISKERFEEMILQQITIDTDKRELERRFKYLEQEEQYERRDATFNSLGLSKVLRILNEIGYDEEQRAIDKAAYGEEAGSGAGFELTLQYLLDGKDLVVKIPEGGLKYPEQLHLQTIDLLPYFGAGSVRETGYLVVPDGSGALIHFNNGKLGAQPYVSTIYGNDKATIQRFQPQLSEASRLPLFGIKSGNQALIGIIEEGDAAASIRADISSRIHSYNTVFSSFTISSKEEVILSAGQRSNTVSQFQATPFQGEIAVRYGFIEGEQANYAGMAAYYREYLIARKGLTKLEEQEGLPFYVELIGGIPKEKFFLGIPYQSYEALTTFDQAIAILEEMKAAGISNTQLRYTGWFNKGVAHHLPKSIKTDSRLGGNKGMKRLQTYVTEQQVGFYPDVAFWQVHKKGSGFSTSRDAARFITGKVALLYPYNIASQLQDKSKEPEYILRPDRLAAVTSSFLKDYRKLNLSGLSLRDLGDTLHSDYNRQQVITRQEAKELAIEELSALQEASGEMLISGGNAYAVPYARHVVNAPLTSSGFLITDESIPFYQLVFHGYVDYAGEAMNLEGMLDRDTQLLKLLETGANPYYTWFHADASRVIQTDFDYLYSSDYRNWLTEAAELYQELDSVLGSARTSIITGHEQLASGVYQTSYENGQRVIVNYNNYEVQVAGKKIAGKSYAAGGEGS